MSEVAILWFLSEDDLYVAEAVNGELLSVQQIGTVKMKYSLEDAGIDHAQYFPGVGTYGTEWDEAYTGAGSTLREAIDDVLESAAQSGVNTDEIENPTAEFSDEQLDAPLHDPSDECQADNENCEHQHYAVLYVREEE